jgi:hypothetical protein
MKRKQRTAVFAKFKKTMWRHVKLALVPHAANRHQPHLIRWYGLSAVLVLVIGIQAVYNFSASGSVLGAAAPINAQQLLNDTNVIRERAGEKPLKPSIELSKAAFLKANDMLQKQYWAHTAPDGTTPWHWFTVAGYNYAAAGENLAKNFSSADAVTAAWMASPEHKKNILTTTYSDVGFAVVDGTLGGNQTTLVVALYGEPAAKAAVLAATQAAEQKESLMARFGLMLQSLTPAAFASLFLVAVGMSVALSTHFSRQKLPKKMRDSWYRHHGMMKAGGMASLAVIMIFLYGGGQI